MEKLRDVIEVAILRVTRDCLRLLRTLLENVLLGAL